MRARQWLCGHDKYKGIPQEKRSQWIPRLVLSRVQDMPFFSGMMVATRYLFTKKRNAVNEKKRDGLRY